MEEGKKRTGIEDALFQLLEKSRDREMEQGNLLLLLSLVNLMGIVDIIQFKVGVEKESGQKVKALEATPAELNLTEKLQGMPFDPKLLQSILGGKEGVSSGAGPLADMLHKMMTPPAGSPKGSDTATKTKGEELEKAAE